MYDNKVVLVASNIHRVEPTHKVRRYNGEAQQHIDVPCPGLIKSYNANMGGGKGVGVATCDKLLALYRNEQKNHKWYKSRMFHMLDL